MKILHNKKKNLYTGGIRSGIAMEIYEKIRYYREHTDFSQRNVAKILGFSSQSHFTRVFKEVHGMTPTEFRKSQG